MRVVAGSDDAEESSAGAVSLTSTDLELVNDGSLGNQKVGMRFRALDIPRGATITRAHVVFATDETGSAAASLTLRGQASDNAPAFTTSSGNVSSRSLTTAQVSWTPGAWATVGQTQQTPDLSAIITEIVARANWAPGNAIALVVTGTGRRTAEAFEGSAAQAPLLHVEFSAEPPPPPACGDGVCNGDETCTSCTGDCGACPDPNLTRFAVIGDFGKNNSAEAAVAAMVTSWNPDFVVTAGDNNYENGAASTIDANIGKYYAQYIGNYTGAYGPGSPTNRFWPTLGNHDWGQGNVNAHLNYFTLPGNERYYDVDLGVVHLYAVDSDSREPDGVTAGSVQGTWLQSRLASSTACWDIVVFHHAAYSSGALHGSTVGMRWPFETWGADGVITGHEHLYERLQVGGIPYFVNGLGGATTYSFAASPLPQSVVRYSGNKGAMLVEASNGSITYRFYSVDGVLRDEHMMHKNCP